MFVISHIPLASWGVENWPLVAPLLLALAVAESLALVVLFWESWAPSVFSPLITSVVALPGCTHVSQQIISHLHKYILITFRVVFAIDSLIYASIFKHSPFQFHSTWTHNHLATYFSVLTFPSAANIHTSACCFLGPSCASWVGVSNKTAVSNEACCGWLEVPASVSHSRWLTLSLSSLSLSALASLSFFSISTRSNRHGLWEEEELHLLLKNDKS